MKMYLKHFLRVRKENYEKNAINGSNVKKKLKKKINKIYINILGTENGRKSEAGIKIINNGKG